MPNYGLLLHNPWQWNSGVHQYDFNLYPAIFCDVTEGNWREREECPKMPSRGENLIHGNNIQRWDIMCFKLKLGTGDFIVTSSQDGKYISLPVKMMRCGKWLPGGPWWEFRGWVGLRRSRTSWFLTSAPGIGGDIATTVPDICQLRC